MMSDYARNDAYPQLLIYPADDDGEGLSPTGWGSVPNPDEKKVIVGFPALEDGRLVCLIGTDVQAINFGMRLIGLAVQSRGITATETLATMLEGLARDMRSKGMDPGGAAPSEMFWTMPRSIGEGSMRPPFFRALHALAAGA